MRYVFLVLALLGHPGCFGPAQADDTETVSLTCHGTRFTAISHSVHSYATAQEIWAHPAGAGQSRMVDLRQSTIVLRRGVPGLAVLTDRVTAWGCATTSKASLLILQYDCPQLLPEDVPARFCSESGEWYRYIALDGSLLDTGFGLGLGDRDSDPRERGLRARLGLPPDDEDVRFQEIL